jgi:dolichol kinase
MALSLGAAGVIIALPGLAGATILAAATFIALAVELGRRVSPAFSRTFGAFFGPMLRPGEARTLTGATTLSMGFTAAALLFPGSPALAGVLIAGLADPGAALVGRRFGRVRYRGGKSVEGSIGFLIVAFVVLAAMPDVPLASAALVAGLAALLEAPTLPVDDNLYLPAVTAALFVLFL